MKMLIHYEAQFDCRKLVFDMNGRVYKVVVLPMEQIRTNSKSEMVWNASNSIITS